MSSKQLEGKVAIVTGAGQGVGQGIAYALAAEGCAVTVSGRTLSKCEVTAKEIEARGGRAIALGADVLSADDLARTLDATLSEFGRLDVLVNNAQVVPLGTLHDVTEENFVAGWESGPLAAFRFMKLAYPHLKQTRGSIVNLGSAAALRWDSAGYGCYGAVKEGIRQLTRQAACEWGPDGIRANCILPLATSPGMEAWIEHRPEEAQAFLATVPLGRVGDCEDDIGRVVVFLASDAAAYVTGQSLLLDGGQAKTA
jgi:NAD(P)-dependent dehydrogenase (short-subunit alcohol dehydrogenase family)